MGRIPPSQSPLKDPAIMTYMKKADLEHTEHGAESFDMAAIPLMYDACFHRAEWQGGHQG